jgi:hypothetical protein
VSAGLSASGPGAPTGLDGVVGDRAFDHSWASPRRARCSRPLRSKAVHGSSQPKPAEMALCYEALDYAINALKAVFKERLNLLEDKDGIGRSPKLILEYLRL